jgi:hypothetical protein
MAKPAEVIEQLKELDKDTEIMLDIWTSKDVKTAAESMYLELDDKDIVPIMKKVVADLNPEEGITFDTVCDAILDIAYPDTVEWDKESGIISYYDDDELELQESEPLPSNIMSQ